MHTKYDSAGTFDLDLEDGHPIPIPAREAGETEFAQIKARTNVPSPNERYMAGITVTAIVDDDRPPGSQGAVAALTLLPQNAIIQLRPNWTIYMVEGEQQMYTLADNGIISSSATAVIDFTSGDGADKAIADLILLPNGFQL